MMARHDVARGTMEILSSEGMGGVENGTGRAILLQWRSCGGCCADQRCGGNSFDAFRERELRAIR